MTVPLPRYVIPKPLAGGRTGFYFNVPTYYRKLGCTIPNEPLGTNYIVACGQDGKGGRAAALNALFDEWTAKREGEPVESIARYGTVDWLFRTYKASGAYLDKVSIRSRPDYERTMLLVSDIVTKKGDRIGDRRVMAITPVSADKLYTIILNGPRGARPRQAEKAAALCRKVWKVVRRLHPDQFDRDVPNPWDGVTKKVRTKARKPAATREEAYAFAWGCIERGEPEAGAAAVICFEWLQRPENVLAGYLSWSDYRSQQFPASIRIEHHKTGEMIWHPLEEQTEEGLIEFYPEAEAVLAKLPRRGISMILYPPPHRKGKDPPPAKPYSFGGMQKIVQRMRAEIGLPKTFTLDACRHGGMTELEEAELTDGQGRALSAHKSQQSYEGYAKRTMKRALAATRKRRAHVLGSAAAARVEIPLPVIERSARVPAEARVYFIRQGKFIKIGFTTDIDRRLSELSTTAVGDLEIVKTVPGSQETEAWFHSRFAEHHARNEWFHDAGDLAAFLADKSSTPLQNAADFLVQNGGKNKAHGKSKNGSKSIG